MSVEEQHSHTGVNEVNFCVIAQSSASGSSSKLFNLVSLQLTNHCQSCLILAIDLLD